MIDAIATVSISGTLEDKLRAAAAAGFTAVEIFDQDFLASDLTARQVRALMDDLGLACVLYQPFRDLEGMPEPQRTRAFQRIEQKFQVMQVLGCDRILLCTNCSPLASPDEDRMVADLRDLGDLAARYGVTVGYEALAWARHIFDHRDAWRIVQKVDHPNIGILLDSFHSLSRGIPIESLREIRPEKIVFVQLADAPILSMDLLYWSRHFRNLPGQGGFDLTGYVGELFRLGYEGPLSLEIFNDRFRANSALMVAQDGLRSLTAIRDAAARSIGAPVTMPPPAQIDHVEFVEFAVDEADREPLEALLRSAGFAPAGSHRDKAVDLWCNGAARFVLNFEQEGFAHAYRLTHGTSICAIGLAVADQAATIARARALGITEHPTDIPAMPALRGVAGSLVYVLDSADVAGVWDGEFDTIDAGSPGAAVGVTGIDHLAAVVHNDEFLSWQLYWRVLFDVRVQQPQDVIDPNGLVQSQAIQNPSGTFRLTLNSTDARGALSARFLSHSFGAGFQHIALAVADMTQAARALDARGLPRLPVPENYQDDAEVRFALSPEQSDAARRFDIMLDEDAEGGRYAQLYSRAFARTFFFEYVERVGYDGYGAPNAPIRLAAQSRFRPLTEAD
ncbi:sugar phosphate isomerase/epimerase and 4-hydroxyphenylpyruvate domain-containing protein [Sphingomonas sp. AP4-R1]|uniref:bifunctional sugar phosphate isomerase/epimerase/4-hydroxyphenylpyruvate dioxygenase family protein n=1 Tax=Sphingomonas sp. AP4-R1 TaxID=2735134 RepID=UPI00149366C1|nr:sugar phosphate isomerase/epimerase and 4-hydroxyphenylpyruvate domain-containing protein [Sphingomonas sp. AP4-R1]QJU60025.1 sugar phosphate isomerase/epimerase and 4-hydroxyphenylpyruvate domain-containing protein [Sphingomonas sp. AP4-R1]